MQCDAGRRFAQYAYEISIAEQLAPLARQLCREIEILFRRARRGEWKKWGFGGGSRACGGGQVMQARVSAR